MSGSTPPWSCRPCTSNDGESAGREHHGAAREPDPVQFAEFAEEILKNIQTFLAHFHLFLPGGGFKSILGLYIVLWHNGGGIHQ